MSEEVEVEAKSEKSPGKAFFRSGRVNLIPAFFQTLSQKL